MAIGLIDTYRGDFFEDGVSPRQRRVYLMRWNPSISGFTKDHFEEYFNYFNGKTKSIENPNIVWTIWDWKVVKHRDLFVMMQVGQKMNGIVWGGFLNGAPYQYKEENGKLTRSRFIECTVMYMHKIEKTGLLTFERLSQEIPEIDWLHGHAGELLSIDSSEKLGLFLVKELLKAEANNDFYFDNYNQKKYVLADILTFMCPKLKQRLIDLGKNKSDQNDVNNLMVGIEDENYQTWSCLEEHLFLEELNGILL